jgi:hypothetical protein
MNKHLTVLAISALLLSGCGSESKASPFLKQICSDWNTSNYASSSINDRENLTTNFSSQVTSAVAVDATAAADFQVAINIMKNVVVLENQASEFSAKGFVENSEFWKNQSSQKAKQARDEITKVVVKFTQVCKS